MTFCPTPGGPMSRNESQPYRVPMVQSDKWLSRYGLMKNCTESVTGTGMRTGTTKVTTIAL